jgi:predicted GNAT family acetyltransferase
LPNEKMSKQAHILDNPIWHSLLTEHASFAEGDDLARRYPAEVSPLAGIKEQSRQAYDALGELLAPQEPVVLFLEETPRPPEGWKILRNFLMDQMVCTTPPRVIAQDSHIEELGVDDVPEMIALAELTEPGPFRKRTIEFGGYAGIRSAGRLAAMTGQRTHPAGFTEVSAVGTHPDFRGRGYAKVLVSAVARSIDARNETPFLGVRQDNASAIRVYQSLGFVTRRALYVSVLMRP